MSITYTYQIVAVSEEFRTMEIMYSSPGRTQMYIGARLPFEGETVESVVKMYAPVAYWLEQEASVVVPEAGTTGEIAPEVLPPLPTVPPVVTMRQARTALLQAGLLPQVDAAIAALPSPQKEAAEIEWEYSQVVERDRPFVATLGVALNLTSEQVDNLFIAAAAL